MTLGEIQAKVLARVGAPDAVFWTAAEATEAINAAQRVFTFFTWCLESRGTLALSGDQTEARLLGTFPSLIAVTRVENVDKERLFPSSVGGFAAASDRWRGERATYPGFYAVHGFDYAMFFPAPSAATSLTVTYARGPAALASAGDVPEIPEEYHAALVDGAEPLLRMKEGGQEFAKAKDSWKKFLTAASECSARVRERNQRAGYDRGPAEVIDNSR